jgi:hypothetical protein
MANAHFALIAARRRGAVGYGQMVMNARDQEAIEDRGGGAVVGGVRYTNPSLSSRLRGAW